MAGRAGPQRRESLAPSGILEKHPQGPPTPCPATLPLGRQWVWDRAGRPQRPSWRGRPRLGHGAGEPRGRAPGKGPLAPPGSTQASGPRHEAESPAGDGGTLQRGLQCPCPTAGSPQQFQHRALGPSRQCQRADVRPHPGHVRAGVGFLPPHPERRGPQPLTWAPCPAPLQPAQQPVGIIRRPWPGRRRQRWR